MLRKLVKQQTLWLGLIPLLLPCLAAAIQSNDSIVIMPPVNVMFGTRSLEPDTPVDDQSLFVYQSVTLPRAQCEGCEKAVARKDVKWKISGMSDLPESSRPERGWYVMRSELQGIGVGVEVKPDRVSGEGRVSKEIQVGLVRLAHETGAGLISLTPAEFRRQTLFYDNAGQVLHIQEDSIRVNADLRVPTCTSSAGNLIFQLPDIDQAYMRRNVKPGHYTETKASQEQVIVANCSSNTQNLQVRFIPGGTVYDSLTGPETILAGTNVASGRESGAGFLMRFNLTGYGQSRKGVVRWNRNFPLVIRNPLPIPGDGSLNQGIRLMLRAYYARPQRGGEIVAGQVTAKGVYQVSYD